MVPSLRPLCLVVEPDPGVLALLSVGLPRFGLGVVPAADSAAAAAALGTRGAGAPPIELALIALRLPGPDGVAAIRALRRLRPALPCCLMAGYLGPGEEAEAWAAGAAAVLLKPFTAREAARVLSGLGGLAPGQVLTSGGLVVVDGGEVWVRPP